MRVLMVDDHIMFLQGMKNLLSVLVQGITVDIAGSLQFALQLLRTSTYDLVLLDWHLTDCEGGEAIERLRNSGCMGRIVVLSAETSTSLIRVSIDQGAAGFIPKSYSYEQMVSALEKVLTGHIFLPPECLSQTEPYPAASHSVGMDPRFSSLTERQIEAYQLAARGLSNKLIARELGIAQSTVKTHLSAVYAALGVKNRTEAAYQTSRDGVRIA